MGPSQPTDDDEWVKDGKIVRRAQLLLGLFDGSG